MNGYFARVGLCSGTTSVDFGSYSSIDIVCAEATADRAAPRSAAPRRRRRSARTVARLLLRQDRFDLARVVHVVAGEQPDDPVDRQAPELRVATGPRAVLRGERGEQRDV